MAKIEDRDYASEIAVLLGFDPDATVRVVIDLDAHRMWTDDYVPITIYQVLGPEKFDALKAAIEESHKGVQPITAQVLVERSPGDRALDALRFDIANENESLRVGVEAIKAYVQGMRSVVGDRGVEHPGPPALIAMCDRILATEEIDAEGQTDEDR